MLLQMVGFHFSHVWIIFHFIYIPHFLYPFIHWGKNSEVVSISWLLWVMLQWTWGYRYIFKTVTSFPSDIYPNCWSFVYLLWKNVCSGPLPIFHQIICFIDIELYEFYIYFEYQSLVWYILCKYFLLFCRLPLHSVDFFFGYTEAFSFDVDPLVYFCFCCFCFECHTKKN